MELLRQRYPDEPYRLYSAMLTADLADASKGDMVGRLKGVAITRCACVP
ncbi:MAG: hypothetical protein IPL78_30535 [Chloroflexi bacterium]|nr:hypothetical protein [Chloroflexota bacterium]